MENIFKILFFLTFYCTSTYGQIENFNLMVTSTNETCTANGSITFSVSNILPGSTVIYTIYKLPNLITPITVTISSPFTGLNSGTYRIIATQSLGNQSAAKQQDVTIVHQIATLTYLLTSTKEICGADGTITVITTSGTAVEYEIISGPILKPLQTSNVFTGLSAGTYNIRVFDVCGEAIVQTYTLEYANPALVFTLIPPALTSCTVVKIGFSIDKVFPTGTIKYPLQVTTVVNPPGSTSIIATSTINGGLIFQSLFQLYSPQPYTYSFTIVDGCGNSQTINGVINNLNVSSSYVLNDQDCTRKNITFNNVTEVILVTAPSTFSSVLPINYTSQIVNNEISILNLVAGTYVFNVKDICGVDHVYTIIVEISTSPLDPYFTLFNRTCLTSSVLIFGIQQLIMISAPQTYNVTLPFNYSSLINPANYAGFNNLPIGVYQFSTIDLCGEPKPLTIVINPISESPTVTVLEGCDVGLGSLKIAGQITSILLTSAPSSYTSFTIPHDFTSSLISNSSALVIGLLPPGTYIFKTRNACNVEYTITAQILGLVENSTATIIPNCGSFNINLAASSNSSNNSYWLQKWNPTASLWVHPSTNIPYPNGVLPTNINSVELNTVITLNLTYLGQFRILKVYKTYIDNTNTPINCFRVIKEFEFTGQPSIKEVLSISCGTTFEVLVTAEGVAPLQYRITTKNGQPFVVQNGTSNYFANLEPAFYNFQVEDSCGNIVNRIFEIANPNPVTITASTVVCNGETLTMTVPDFSFLEYQWWKDNNSSTILSTTNELTIASFNASVNNGTYHVRIVYPNNPNSCLNQELTYTISLNVPTPNAGQGSANTYCGAQGTIDLFSLLQGNYQTDGIWTEISNSGTLTNNFWNSNSITSGTYSFNYRVTGSCSLFANSVVSITLFPIPNAPIASTDTLVCESLDINLYASTISNTDYFWTGPNGFTSMQQNPTLTNVSSFNNGFYSVYVTQNNCQSVPDEVEVLVNPLPDFILNQECFGKDYVVSAILDENTTNGIFSWTGPELYTSNQNPINITRAEVGIYSLIITNSFGCSTTKDIEVIRTFCEIPNVITPNNDGANEELNLIGFGVKKIEIYNRWGRLVFEKNNYSNEWHGQNQKGEKLPDGTYFYLISLGTNEQKNGWIFLSGN